MLTICPVVVDTPQHSGLTEVLHYSAPTQLAPGALLRVPLGKRQVLGMVWEGEAASQEDQSDRALKSIDQVLDLPPLSNTWRALIRFAAQYYQRGLGELGLGVLPPELRQVDQIQLARRLKRLHKHIANDEKSKPDHAVSEAVPAELNASQAQALEHLTTMKEGVTVLWGVTGSGKTEVYLRHAEQVMLAGRQILVLVPEINLTPQLFERFAQRFPHRRVVAMHSGLTPAQRLQHWLMAHLGNADIVVGTRMAVFASMPRLGLIVVDEEHDPSFKQQEGARYSARDLAVMRGHLEHIPVVLGSATPSIETWHNMMPSEEGAPRYQRLEMPERIGQGAMPAVTLIDWNTLKAQHGAKVLHEWGAISPPLLTALQQRLDRGEQSLLLLNRRGYAPVLHCPECSWKSGCAHCSAWRVFHKQDRTLRCHHCGFTDRVPRACPECGNVDIQPIGRGTEKLEEQIAQLLPQARVARIDADTTRHQGALEALLNEVHSGAIDILIGTQMVAKGHDFRRMTLVAAVNPDGALFSSDFRAPERLFSLLMQAAGRAGRDAEVAKHSEMLIQTWNPEHALYRAVKQHDYASFANQQLQERQMAGLPPYSHLALMRVEAKTQVVSQEFLKASAALAQQIAGADQIFIYPVVPPPIQRVADIERSQMLIEAQSRKLLQRFLAEWLPQLQSLRSQHSGLIRWAVDVDPLSI